jgi:hypothetical protein
MTSKQLIRVPDVIGGVEGTRMSSRISTHARVPVAEDAADEGSGRRGLPAPISGRGLICGGGIVQEHCEWVDVVCVAPRREHVFVHLFSFLWFCKSTIAH